MRIPHHRSDGGAACSAFVVSVCCAIIATLLSSCSPDLPVQREAQRPAEGALAPRFSIVFIIHGDGDYLYHDTGGNEWTADDVALAGAKRVAEQNPEAEVFIFHQKARRHFLFLFPLHDGEFYYYRNGELIADELYWRDQAQADLEPELGMYRRWRAANQEGSVKFFLYYGHEIPEFDGRGYDASYPDRPFTVDDLAVGLRGFTRDSGKFDLVVLSTCFGGTPHTIGTLGSFARCIIASPDNLHLSYFDLRGLERLDLNMPDGDVLGFARRFARQAYERLTRDVETAVSVAVYDVAGVQEYVHAVHDVYDHTLSTLQNETQASGPAIDHCDCADLPGYVLPTMHKGVEVFYRPARFGKTNRNTSHSGWECWRETGQEAASSRIAVPLHTP